VRQFKLSYTILINLLYMVGGFTNIMPDLLCFLGFLISFFMLFVSSYFLSSIIKSKSSFNSCIYFVLIFLSQIIFSIEILSLLKNINILGILISNAIILTAATVLWKIFKGKNFLNVEKLKLITFDILTNLKKDKGLLAMSVVFAAACIILLLLTIFVPTDNMDSLTYRLARVALWSQNGSLSHFATTSIRQLCFPINFEIILLWSFIFLKRDFLVLFPSFLSYFGCLGLIFGYLKYFKVSTKRILWTVLVTASIPIFILEASSAQSDLFMGFLLMSAFYLLVYSIREKEAVPAIFVGLSYAIAIGAKSTAFLFVPVFALATVLIYIKEKDKKPVKQLLLATVSFITFFALLSAYNYIQNFLTFKNVFGPESIVSINTVSGFRPFPVNIVRFFFAFIDLPGIDYVGMLPLKLANFSLITFINNLIASYGVNFRFGVNMGAFEGFNLRVHENYASFGLFAYILIVPCILNAFSKLKAKNTKTFYIALTGLFLPGFFLMVLLFMGYSVWSLRYFTTAAAISASILAFSYRKKADWYKYLIIFIVIFNFVIYSVYNWEKPLIEVIRTFSKQSGYMEARRDLRLRNGFYYENNYKEYYLLNQIKDIIPENATIGLFITEEDSIYPYFEEGKNWKIFQLRYDDFVRQKDFNYDYLISGNKTQEIYALNSTPAINYNYDDTAKKLTFENESDAGIPKKIYFDKYGQIIVKGSNEKAIREMNFINEKSFSSHYIKFRNIDLTGDESISSRNYSLYKRTEY